MEKEKRNILKELSLPFLTADGKPAHKWKAGAVSRDKKKISCFAYIDARQARERLNIVMGVDWQHKITKLTKNGNIMEATCEMSLLIDSEWRTRTDVGTAGTSALKDSRGEEIQVKGAVSDSIKRAAANWGVGAYLYGLNQQWVGYDLTSKMPTVDGKKLYPQDLNNYLNRISTNSGLFYQMIKQRPELKNDRNYIYIERLLMGGLITPQKK